MTEEKCLQNLEKLKQNGWVNTQSIVVLTEFNYFNTENKIYVASNFILELNPDLTIRNQIVRYRLIPFQEQISLFYIIAVQVFFIYCGVYTVSIFYEISWSSNYYFILFYLLKMVL